ncbi:MAG: hypothetical protein AMXMBFR84_21480 [Candidatus Hydrogenedentota bacterium]
MYHTTVEFRGDPNEVLSRMREVLLCYGYRVSDISGGMITATFQPSAKDREQRGSLACATRIAVSASRSGLTVEADLSSAFRVAVAVVVMFLVFDAFLLFFAVSTWGFGFAAAAAGVSIVAAPLLVFGIDHGIRRQFKGQMRRLLVEAAVDSSPHSR